MPEVVESAVLEALTAELSAASSFTEVLSAWVGSPLELDLRESELVSRRLDTADRLALSVDDERLLSRRAFLRAPRRGFPAAEVFAVVALDRLAEQAAAVLLEQSLVFGPGRPAVVSPLAPLGALLKSHHPDLERVNAVSVTSRCDASGAWQCLRVSGVLSAAGVALATTTEYVYSDAARRGL